MNLSIYGHFSKSVAQEFVHTLSERAVPTSPSQQRGPSLCLTINISDIGKKSIIHVGTPFDPVRGSLLTCRKIVFSFSSLLSNKSLHSCPPFVTWVFFWSMTFHLLHPDYNTVSFKRYHPQRNLFCFLTCP